MKKRLKEILDLLAKRKNDYMISTLAIKFEVSERTIRNDIKDYLKEQEITPIWKIFIVFQQEDSNL